MGSNTIRLGSICAIPPCLDHQLNQMHLVTNPKPDAPRFSQGGRVGEKRGRRFAQASAVIWPASPGRILRLSQFAQLVKSELLLGGVRLYFLMGGGAGPIVPRYLEDLKYVPPSPHESWDLDSCFFLCSNTRVDLRSQKVLSRTLKQNSRQQHPEQVIL